MNGIIISIDSRQSKVISNGKVYLCEAKGILKKDFKPRVGDKVIFDIIDEKQNHGIITKILDRINELYRPKIVNIDQVLIVTALKKPTLATYILNKYIAMLEIKKIDIVLIFTKTDLLTNWDNDIKQKIEDYKKIGFKVLEINNKSIELNQIEELKYILKNKISVFTGQTGAGKSSTLNNLLGSNEQIRTQEISESLNRGKHTTTGITIYNLEPNILIADTPGFSSFEFKDITVEELSKNIRAFKPFLKNCKFLDCKHTSELQCGVKEAVKNNELPEFIYDDYLKMYNEIILTRKVWK